MSTRCRSSTRGRGASRSSAASSSSRAASCPFGTEPFQPSDPKFAEAYGPLDLNGNTALAVSGQRFAERDELDRALFGVIELMATPRVTSDLRADLDVGVSLVRRAEALSGLSEEQRASLTRLRAEVAYFLARQRLIDARRHLDDALTQLRLAADTESRHRKEATQMLLSVEPQVKGLSDALRAAVEGLSVPPPPPPSPGPPLPAPSADGGAHTLEAVPDAG